ncbi:hypothetical protein GCM10009677_28080 [Sphaerisporangium rubeum]|uniref:Uncharacterized protein n=1 Tax=Sphaerisporangium rubeum TaxID=321317 RepID=A0A7X0IFA9_9ACTN|nr:hypothetical protein [Sphaerisporangium rubeum]MBB6472918.1 hypothetical protein [Sphaerisporangium rubeum]
MGQPQPGTGPLSPDFTGMDPPQMDAFINTLDHARSQIAEHTEAIRLALNAAALPTSSLNPITEIEHWIDTKLVELRRRNETARATSNLPGWTPEGTPHLIPYKEETHLTPAEARALGTALATRYKTIDPGALFDPGLDEKYQHIIDTLADHTADPNVTAAFFATLGLRHTLTLRHHLRRGLQESDDSAVDTVSKAFATAVTAGTATPGFATIANAMKNRAESHNDQQAIGDLISTGRFPTEWLAQVAAAQIFTLDAKATGKTLTPYLNALAEDPSAARLAIALATKDTPLPKDTFTTLVPPTPPTPDKRPDLATFLRTLNTRTSTDPTSADAFGKLLAAASGAYNEKDGAHTPEASRFAFTVMTTLDDVNLGEETRVHLSEIAGSYATEILEGANLGDRNHILDSSNTPVDSSLPGLKPAFRLSPEDTYRFLKTFTNNLANQIPFHAGMDRLTTRLVDEAVPQMIKSNDPTRLDDIFGALGNVRGFELTAREAWGNAKDQAAEETRQLQSLLIGNAMGVVGLAFEGGKAMIYTGLSAVCPTTTPPRMSLRVRSTRSERLT